MHLITFVPLLVVGAAARPALLPPTMGAHIPYPTLLSKTMSPGNMMHSLPIHPRKAETTSEPSFRSVTEEEDAAKAKEDKKAKKDKEDKKAKKDKEDKKAEEDKKAADDKEAEDGSFDVDAFIATLDTPESDPKAIQDEALAGIDQDVEKRQAGEDHLEAFLMKFDGEGEYDEAASDQALERFYKELESEQSSESDIVEEPKTAKATSDKSAGSPKNETSSDANSQSTKVVDFKKLVDEDVNASAPKNETSTKGSDAKYASSISRPDLSGGADGHDIKTDGLQFKRQFYDFNEKTAAQAEAKAHFHDEMQNQMNPATPTTHTEQKIGNAAFKAPAPVPSKPAPAGLDAVNEEWATLLDNLPMKRQESEEENVDAKNATSTAKNETSSAASGFHGINDKLNMLNKLPIGGLPIKRQESEGEKVGEKVDAKNATSTAKNETSSAASGSYNINDKLNMLNKLPIGGLPIKRQAPAAPAVPMPKPSGSLLDKYLVSLKNQHEKPAAAAAPSVPSEEELSTVAADATSAALSEYQPETKEPPALVPEGLPVNEFAANPAEVKPETEESSPFTGLGDKKPEPLSTPEVASLSEETPETEESSPFASLADEKSEEVTAPEDAISSLEALPETEESSPLALAEPMSEKPEASPASEEMPASEESSPLASLPDEKLEDLSAPKAASEPKPEAAESSTLATLPDEKLEDLSAPNATSELKPEVEESSPLATLPDEKLEDLSAPKATSELKPEVEESAPLAELAGEMPEAPSATAAGGLPTDPKSELASPLAGLMG
jgi:hypothetical protein